MPARKSSATNDPAVTVFSLLIECPTLSVDQRPPALAAIRLRPHNKTVQACRYPGVRGSGNQVLSRAVRNKPPAAAARPASRAPSPHRRTWPRVPILSPVPTAIKMAGAAGLELATAGFGDQCSAKLSYTPATYHLARSLTDPQAPREKAHFTAHLMIFVTTPEPTVRPPSRIANRTPSSIAIGLCSSTVIFTLSPGMHISASTKLAVPVTSVVRK